MNTAILIGRLTKDIELKYTQGGKAYCKFTIAIPREFNKEETDFISCQAWEKRAETLAEYVKKGKRVAVQGRVQTGSYEKDGITVYTTDVIVDKFNILDFENKKNDDVSDEDFPF